MKRMKKSLKVLVIVLVLMLAFQSVAMGTETGVTGYVLEFDGGHHYFDLAKLVTSYLAYVDIGPTDPAARMFKTYFEMRVPTDTTKAPATPVGYTIAGVSEFVDANTIIDLYKDFKTADSTSAITQIITVLVQLNELMTNADPTNVLAQKVQNTVQLVTAGDDGTPITVNIIGEDGQKQGEVTIGEDGTVSSGNDPIDAVAIEKAALAPAKDKAVPTAIAGVPGVNISVKWTDTAKADAEITGKFAIGQVPKATLTITPVFGYEFDEVFAVTYDGKDLGATLAAGAYTASVQFDELKDAPPTAAITGVEVKDATTVVVTLDAAMADLTANDFIVEVNVDAEDDDAGFTVGFTVAPGTANDTYTITLAEELTVGDVVTVTGEGTKVTGSKSGEYEVPPPEYGLRSTSDGPGTYSLQITLDGEDELTKAVFIVWYNGSWYALDFDESGLIQGVDPSVGHFFVKDGARYMLIIGKNIADGHGAYDNIKRNAPESSNGDYWQTAIVEFDDVFSGELDLY